jgi:hypothetical protein
MSPVKYAAAVVALIMTIAGGLYAFDSTYCRYAMFWQHKVEHVEEKIFTNQQMIWKYEDRLKTNPNDNTSKTRIRELKYQNEVLKKKLGGEK